MLAIWGNIGPGEHRMREIIWGNGHRYGVSPMFPRPYIPRVLCSPVLYSPIPMFPRPKFPSTYIPRVLCSPELRLSCVPRVLCSPVPMFPPEIIPLVLYSPVPMFPGCFVWRVLYTHILNILWTTLTYQIWTSDNNVWRVSAEWTIERAIYCWNEWIYLIFHFHA